MPGEQMHSAWEHCRSGYHCCSDHFESVVVPAPSRFQKTRSTAQVVPHQDCRFFPAREEGGGRCRGPRRRGQQQERGRRGARRGQLSEAVDPQNAAAQSWWAPQLHTQVLRRLAAAPSNASRGSSGLQDATKAQGKMNQLSDDRTKPRRSSCLLREEHPWNKSHHHDGAKPK